MREKAAAQAREIRDGKRRVPLLCLCRTSITLSSREDDGSRKGSFFNCCSKFSIPKLLHQIAHFFQSSPVPGSHSTNRFFLQFSNFPERELSIEVLDHCFPLIIREREQGIGHPFLQFPFFSIESGIGPGSKDKVRFNIHEPAITPDNVYGGIPHGSKRVCLEIPWGFVQPDKAGEGFVNRVFRKVTASGY
jgi:hypothetical protein